MGISHGFEMGISRGDESGFPVASGFSRKYLDTVWAEYAQRSRFLSDSGVNTPVGRLLPYGDG